MCKIILPSLNLRIEKWKWNKEYRIFVSSLGNFKDEHKKNMPIRISSKTGYCMIETPYGIKQAHRLVLLTFKPIPNAESLTVDHKNHNKRDNNLSNLEWLTREENQSKAQADLYTNKNEPNQGWKYKQIKAGGKIHKDMDAAIDYAISCMNKNGTTPNRGKVQYKIQRAISNNTLYLKKKWEIINKRKEDIIC